MEKIAIVAASIALLSSVGVWFWRASLRVKLWTLAGIFIVAALAATLFVTGSQYDEQMAGALSPSRSIAGSTGPETAEDVIRRQVSELSQGQIVFNPPDHMTTGKHETVVVRISRQKLQDAIRQNLAGEGVVQSAQLSVGQFMSVDLWGDGFIVTSKSKRDQYVPDSGFAEWLFDVDPEEGGDKDLYLQASVRFKSPYGEETTELPVFDRTVHVKVDYWHEAQMIFIQADGWKWLLGAIGGAILGMLGYFGKRFLEARGG